MEPSKNEEDKLQGLEEMLQMEEEPDEEGFMLIEEGNCLRNKQLKAEVK